MHFVKIATKCGLTLLAYLFLSISVRAEDNQHCAFQAAPAQPLLSFLLTEEDATFVSIRFIEKIISGMREKGKKRKLEVDPIVLQSWLLNVAENKGYSYVSPL